MIRRPWEEKLAEALQRAQRDIYEAGTPTPEVRARFLEREALYFDWLKSRDRKPSRWRRILCWLTDSHRWEMQADYTFKCADCPARREFMPWH